MEDINDVKKLRKQTSGIIYSPNIGYNLLLPWDFMMSDPELKLNLSAGKINNDEDKCKSSIELRLPYVGYREQKPEDLFVC